MNDKERTMWVDNDEGLHRRWRSEHTPKRQWIRENREFIDRVIDEVMSGRKAPHYLQYG